jgi:hypothetical protein
VIGYGKFARPEYDMGMEEEIIIPAFIGPVAAAFHPVDSHAVEATIQAHANTVIRIVLQQRTPEGEIRRTWAGGPPNGENMGNVLKIQALQNGQPLSVRINYDKVIWSGLSWGVGEVEKFAPGEPLVIRCASTERDPVKLDANVYEVRYR